MPTSEYKIMLNRVNQLAERRQTVTTSYISVNAALTGAIAFLFKAGSLSSIIAQIPVLLLLFSSIVSCGLWLRLITHYSTLTGWWYERLRDLEGALFGSRKLITKEYQDLFINKQGKSPIGLTRYETQLTCLFTLIYFLFGLTILVSLILSIFGRR